MSSALNGSRGESHTDGGDASGRDGGDRVLALGSLGAVLLSVASSVVASGLVPAQVRVHWTLGAGPYYGPEVAPAWLVLAGFPAAVAATALVTDWGERQLRRAGEYDGVRPVYVASVLGALAVLWLAQVALVVANL